MEQTYDTEISMKELIAIGGCEYITAAKIMSRFGIGYKAMYTWIENGTLPHPIKLGRRMYFDNHEIDERLLGHTR
jgi:predicted DNA-binding transcriptional regulator AlpA